MVGIRITELDPTTGIESTDQLPTSKGAQDLKITVDELLTYVKDNFTDAEILAKLLNVDTNTSTLNANFLQGLDANFFRNASNLLSGVVPDARLPGESTSPSWTVGGSLHTNAGQFKDYIRIPEFFLNGERYMIQFGWSFFTTHPATQTISFRTPFASGWGNENKPLVLVSPECRSSEWSGSTSSPFGAAANVELDMRVWYTDLNSFKVSTIRTSGADADRVRANWIAFGKY